MSLAQLFGSRHGGASRRLDDAPLIIADREVMLRGVDPATGSILALALLAAVLFLFALIGVRNELKSV